MLELSPNRFSFVIPSYNHGDCLAAVIDGVRQYNCPIFVVDDGSTDRTVEVLRSCTDIHVLRHERNQGKGAALVTGMQAASAHANWVVTIDADGQHNPADARTLMLAANPALRGLVVGNRLGMQSEPAPWTSRFGRKFSNFWVRAAGGPRIRDSQSGFRMYPVPEVLELGARSTRYQLEVEILVLAHWHRLPIYEVDVSVHYSKSERVSHFHPWIDFWRNTKTFSRLICKRVFIPRSKRTKS